MSDLEKKGRISGYTCSVARSQTALERRDSLLLAMPLVPFSRPWRGRETQCLYETVPPAACGHEVIRLVFQDFGVIGD